MGSQVIQNHLAIDWELTPVVPFDFSLIVNALFGEPQSYFTTNFGFTLMSAVVTASTDVTTIAKAVNNTVIRGADHGTANICVGGGSPGSTGLVCLLAVNPI